MNTEIKMIDQIQKTVGKIDPQQSKGSKTFDKPNDSIKSISVTDSVSFKDSADISLLAKSDNVNGLAASAPIDMEQVTAIKNAIASGDYPIDYDRIAEALMDVYKEMKS